MNKKFAQTIKFALGLTTALSLNACFTSSEEDITQNQFKPDTQSITEIEVPDVAFQMMIAPEPMVWGQYHGLDSNDIIISGTSDRSELEGCEDKDNISYYLHYTPVYSSEAEFMEMVKLEEEVELLNPGKIYRYDNGRYRQSNKQ